MQHAPAPSPPSCLEPTAPATGDRLERYRRGRELNRLGWDGRQERADASALSEAAVLLRSVAMEPVDDDIGGWAAMLYLDSLNILGTQAHRVTLCKAAMRADIDALIALHCKHANDTCETLTRVRQALVRE